MPWTAFTCSTRRLGLHLPFHCQGHPRYAKIFAHRAFEATERLEEFPLSGRMVPEVGRKDIRELILGNYRIIYRVRDEEVEILTVHHGARLLKLNL